MTPVSSMDTARTFVIGTIAAIIVGSGLLWLIPVTAKRTEGAARLAVQDMTRAEASVCTAEIYPLDFIPLIGMGQMQGGFRPPAASTSTG